MQHFYDGAIRRYITQTIRLLSNFVVKYGDGSLHRVPVMYGDASRQAASIVRQNSENAVNSVPRISVYIGDLKLDKDRLADATFVGKMHFREREIDQTGNYTNVQGRNYTVERIMPTPFTLNMKVDIWASNTDQKLQILEQILVFFNPSVELQTTDNYIDWTSLSVLYLNDVRWTSRTVPIGTSLDIDIATLTLEAPIWVSPPVKVKQLGIITNIINNICRSHDTSPIGYIDGLGIDTADPTITLSNIISQVKTSITDYTIAVYGNHVFLLESDAIAFVGDGLSTPPINTSTLSWEEIFSNYPGSFKAGISTIQLIQTNNTIISGTVSINIDNSSMLDVEWNTDTLDPNTGIDSMGKLDTDLDYNPTASYRPNSTGTFDAIINPLTFNPKRPNKESTDQPVIIGTRFLLIEDIGELTNIDGADAWKSTSNHDLIAKTNDIIEWNGTQWNVIFNAKAEPDTMIWQTNIHTDIQYVWNGIAWNKSYDKEYRTGEWVLIL